MIECPICHVSNEDRSLFCAECGQRFAPANEATSGLLKPPIPDAIPRRPSAKLRSPMLGGGMGLAAAEENYGFQSSPVNSPEPENLGQANYTYGVSAESQLKANTSNPTQDSGVRRGLHSPLLDSGGAGEKLDGPQRAQSAFPHRQSTDVPPSHSGESKPVRPHKVLRSPLLSGGYEEDVETEMPPQRFNQPRDASTSQADRSGRLHSPVLDGPYGGNQQIEPDDFYSSEEINDPHILRSPLLAARVPVQEKPTAAKAPQPPEELKLPNAVKPLPAAAPPQPPIPAALPMPTAAPPPAGNVPSIPSTPVPPPALSSNIAPIAQPSAPQSVGGFPGSKSEFPLPQMSSPPRVEPAKIEAPRVEPPKFEQPKIEPPKVEAPRVEPPKNVGGFESMSGRELSPASQLVRAPEKAPEVGNKAKPLGQHFAEPSRNDWQESEYSSSGRPFKSAAPSRSVLLDKNFDDQGAEPTGVRTRRLSTPVVGSLLAVLVLAKAYYIFSLGPSAFSAGYFPFLVDQIAQLAVLICLIICA